MVLNQICYCCVARQGYRRFSWFQGWDLLWELQALEESPGLGKRDGTIWGDYVLWLTQYSYLSTFCSISYEGLYWIWKDEIFFYWTWDLSYEVYQIKFIPLYFSLFFPLWRMLRFSRYYGSLRLCFVLGLYFYSCWLFWCRCWLWPLKYYFVACITASSGWI